MPADASDCKIRPKLGVGKGLKQVGRAPKSSEALANAPGKILHIPTVGGADVIIFNLHNVKELKLDGPTLATIYLGKITQWKDPAISQQNPDVKLPDEQITVVHRSNGSGISYILSDYLCLRGFRILVSVDRSIPKKPARAAIEIAPSIATATNTESCVARRATGRKALSKARVTVRAAIRTFN